jgi:hypothetical protein
MEFPLRLKWLGTDTEEIYNLLTPFHPLILISLTPQLQKTPHGLIPLPASISNIWDLNSVGWQQSPHSTDRASTDNGEFRFEQTTLSYVHKNFSDIYEFYFQVYLKNSALRHLKGTASYNYIEWLHHALLENEFLAFIRAFSGDEVIAGCLLKRSSPEALRDCRERLEPPAPSGKTEGLILDLMCMDVRFEGHGINELLISNAAQWAQQNGYSFLSTTQTAPLMMTSAEDNLILRGGHETIPVLHQKNSGLLYCDLHRCSYLRQDFYYYSYDESAPYIHYVANILPPFSQSVRLLNSIAKIEKRAYTRHPSMYSALSEAGIACELIG